MRKYVKGPILTKYLNKVEERRKKGLIQEIAHKEIEEDILNRIIPQKKDGEYCYGIYGYFDKELKIFRYIGKDKYILYGVRNTDHWTTYVQKINQLIQNNKDRFVFKIIDIIPSSNVLEADVFRADILERHYIKVYNTYHYENSLGMNFTKGGETSFGIQTEANINYDKINLKIKSKMNSTYNGERDGKEQLHGVHTIGNDGDSFELTTNGGGDRGTQFAIKNEKKEHEKVLQSMDLKTLIIRFQEDFPNSKLTISERLENEYKNISRKFGFLRRG